MISEYLISNHDDQQKDIFGSCGGWIRIGVCYSSNSLMLFVYYIRLHFSQFFVGFFKQSIHYLPAWVSLSSANWIRAQSAEDIVCFWIAQVNFMIEIPGFKNGRTLGFQLECDVRLSITITCHVIIFNVCFNLWKDKDIKFFEFFLRSSLYLYQGLQQIPWIKKSFYSSTHQDKRRGFELITLLTRQVWLRVFMWRRKVVRETKEKEGESKKRFHLIL